MQNTVGGRALTQAQTSVLLFVLEIASLQIFAGVQWQVPRAI